METKCIENLDFIALNIMGGGNFYDKFCISRFIWDEDYSIC